jgi:hypothetical protein
MRPVLFRSKDRVEEARLIANGLWRPEPGQWYAGEDLLYETSSFDFGHLQNPVPASVYFDAREDCWGEQMFNLRKSHRVLLLLDTPGCVLLA